MDDDRACGAALSPGVLCTRPFGHEGQHAIAMSEITPELGQVIDAALAGYERATERMLKARRWMDVTTVLMGLAALWYIVALLRL